MSNSFEIRRTTGATTLHTRRFVLPSSLGIDSAHAKNMTLACRAAVPSFLSSGPSSQHAHTSRFASSLCQHKLLAATKVRRSLLRRTAVAVTSPRFVLAVAKKRWTRVA